MLKRAEAWEIVSLTCYRGKRGVLTGEWLMTSCYRRRKTLPGGSQQNCQLLFQEGPSAHFPLDHPGSPLAPDRSPSPRLSQRAPPLAPHPLKVPFPPVSTQSLKTPGRGMARVASGVRGGHLCHTSLKAAGGLRFDSTLSTPNPRASQLRLQLRDEATTLRSPKRSGALQTETLPTPGPPS